MTQDSSTQDANALSDNLDDELADAVEELLAIGHPSLASAVTRARRIVADSRTEESR